MNLLSYSSKVRRLRGSVGTSAMGIPGRKARWHPAQGLIWSLWKELFPMPIRDQIQFLTATSPCWLSAQAVFTKTITHQAVPLSVKCNRVFGSSLSL